MQVTGLFHLAIKTGDLDATVKFYSEVLGLTQAYRPDFGFPGAWLAIKDGPAIIHVYAGGPALVNGKAPHGTGADCVPGPGLPVTDHTTHTGQQHDRSCSGHRDRGHLGHARGAQVFAITGAVGRRHRGGVPRPHR